MARIVKKAEDRKDELIEIALGLFMEKGYVHTSIKDIYTQANGSFVNVLSSFFLKRGDFCSSYGPVY